jgi:hypothetical protein
MNRRGFFRRCATACGALGVLAFGREARAQILIHPGNFSIDNTLIRAEALPPFVHREIDPSLLKPMRYMRLQCISTAQGGTGTLEVGVSGDGENWEPAPNAFVKTPRPGLFVFEPPIRIADEGISFGA